MAEKNILPGFELGMKTGISEYMNFGHFEIFGCHFEESSNEKSYDSSHSFGMTK